MGRENAASFRLYTHSLCFCFFFGTFLFVFAHKTLKKALFSSTKRAIGAASPEPLNKGTRTLQAYRRSSKTLDRLVSGHTATSGRCGSRDNVDTGDDGCNYRSALLIWRKGRSCRWAGCHPSDSCWLIDCFKKTARRVSKTLPFTIHTHSRAGLASWGEAMEQR